MQKLRIWIAIIPILCLLSLIACSPKPTLVKEYVKQTVPDIPKEPNYWSVQWTKQIVDNRVLYSLDEQNAKNLLKNIEVMKEYQKDLRTILESLKQ